MILTVRQTGRVEIRRPDETVASAVRMWGRMTAGIEARWLDDFEPRILAVTLILFGVACRCPPTVVSESKSPSGTHTAVIYTHECSAITPFNAYVGIREGGRERLHEIAAVHDLGWTLRASWRTPQDLVITFDCEGSFCSARTDRSWSVRGNSRYRQVRLHYALSPSLRRGLTDENIRQLPPIETAR